MKVQASKIDCTVDVTDGILQSMISAVVWLIGLELY